MEEVVNLSLSFRNSHTSEIFANQTRIVNRNTANGTYLCKYLLLQALLVAARSSRGHGCAHLAQDLIHCHNCPVNFFHGVIEMRREPDSGTRTKINQNIAA